MIYQRHQRQIRKKRGNHENKKKYEKRSMKGWSKDIAKATFIK